VGTVASVALAWTAVSAVGGQVTSPPAGSLTPSQVAAAATLPVTTTTAPPQPGGTDVPPPAPTTPPEEPSTTTTTAPSSSQTFESAGGSVGVVCSGATASLGFATPRAGYATEVHDTGPQRVEVRFEGDAGKSRVTVTCTAGRPDAEIRDE